jgi:hypothetical protein
MTSEAGEIEAKVVAAYLAPFYTDLRKWRRLVQQHLVTLRQAQDTGIVDRDAFSRTENTRDGLDTEIAQFDAAVEHLGGEDSVAATQLAEIGDALQNLRLALMRILVLMQEMT